VLSQQQENALYKQLSEFSYKTSTQLVIVTVDDLYGYDKAQYAVELAHEWGIGQKGKDNGILILVKAKTASSKGEAYIAVGYGLEGVIPDAIARQIVDIEMISEFKKGDYYTGFARTSQVLMELTAGEYTADHYLQTKRVNIACLFPCFIFFILFIVFTRKGRNRSTGIGSRSSIPFWTMMFLGSSMGRSSGSSWGNFNSGGGSFGGGGGFGSFGGGGFGGGGAGGSW